MGVDALRNRIVLLEKEVSSDTAKVANLYLETVTNHTENVASYTTALRNLLALQAELDTAKELLETV